MPQHSGASVSNGNAAGTTTVLRSVASRCVAKEDRPKKRTADIAAPEGVAAVRLRKAEVQLAQAIAVCRTARVAAGAAPQEAKERTT